MSKPTKKQIASRAATPCSALRVMVDRIEKITEEAWTVYNAEVQAIANAHGVRIATGHMSDFWKVKRPRARKWLNELYDEHPAFDDLRTLDAIAIDLRIGPSNMMMFNPLPNSGTKLPLQSKKQFKKQHYERTQEAKPDEFPGTLCPCLGERPL